MRSRARPDIPRFWAAAARSATGRAGRGDERPRDRSRRGRGSFYPLVNASTLYPVPAASAPRDSRPRLMRRERSATPPLCRKTAAPPTRSPSTARAKWFSSRAPGSRQQPGRLPDPDRADRRPFDHEDGGRRERRSGRQDHLYAGLSATTASSTRPARACTKPSREHRFQTGEVDHRVELHTERRGRLRVHAGAGDGGRRERADRRLSR